MLLSRTTVWFDHEVFCRRAHALTAWSPTADAIWRARNVRRQDLMEEVCPLGLHLDLGSFLSPLCFPSSLRWGLGSVSTSTLMDKVL